MLKALEFGGGGNKVFTIVLSIAEKLSDDEFEKDIQPVIVRMFGSQERGIRMALLENLSRIVDRISAKLVNDKIFPNMVLACDLGLMCAVDWIYGCGSRC